MWLTLLKTFFAGTIGFITAFSQPIPTPTPIIFTRSYDGKSMYPTIEQATESASLPLIAEIALEATSSPLPTQTIIPTSTPVPTVTPLPTDTPSPIPTFTPKPTQTPQPPATPTMVPYTPIPTIPHSLNSETIFQLINTYRETIHQPAYQKNEYLCKLAEDRIPELPDEVSGKRYIHQGLYDRNLPYWITENMSYYPSEQAIFNWWLQSSLHRRAIEGNYQYSCGACNGTICIQLFTNFTPR